jgi:hypothetical protein
MINGLKFNSPISSAFAFAGNGQSFACAFSSGGNAFSSAGTGASGTSGGFFNAWNQMNSVFNCFNQTNISRPPQPQPQPYTQYNLIGTPPKETSAYPNDNWLETIGKAAQYLNHNPNRNYLQSMDYAMTNVFNLIG